MCLMVHIFDSNSRWFILVRSIDRIGKCQVHSGSEWDAGPGSTCSHMVEGVTLPDELIQLNRCLESIQEMSGMIEDAAR